MEKSITKGWLGVVALFAALTLALCAFAPSQAYAKVYNAGSNGFQTTKAGKMYFEDAKGNLVKGWFQAKVDGKVVKTFNNQKAWFYADPTTGLLKKGWLNYGGKTYFLSTENGTAAPSMLAFTKATIYKNKVWWDESFGTPYYFNKKGAMQTGWIKVSKGSWYYAKDNGVLVKGWQTINGKKYYFGSKPAASEGADEKGDGVHLSTSTAVSSKDGLPQQIGKYKYYFDGTTAMVTGWKKIKGSWYFFKPSGVMVANKWIKTGAKWSYVGKDGKALAGGFYTIKGKTVKKGAQAIAKGKTYYFTKNAYMVTGWKKIKGDWYFFNGKGVMQATAWILSGGKYYFLQDDGTMAKSTWIDGVWHVNANGAWDKTKSAGKVTGPADGPAPTPSIKSDRTLAA